MCSQRHTNVKQIASWIVHLKEPLWNFLVSIHRLCSKYYSTCQYVIMQLLHLKQTTKTLQNKQTTFPSHSSKLTPTKHQHYTRYTGIAMLCPPNLSNTIKL